MKYREAIQAAGKECIQKALQESSGNVAKAAQELGVKRQALYLIMERHGLHVTRHKKTEEQKPAEPLGFNERRWLK